MDGLFLDAPELEPFWAEAARLGMFVFVHPALKLNHSQQFDGYDTARSVGREFSLVMATIRLINSGVFDRHPEPDRAHVASRRRHRRDARPHAQLPGQGVLGHAGNARHGRKAEKDFDYYFSNNIVFDTAGFCGAIGAVKAALVEIPAVPHRVRHRLPAGDSRAEPCAISSRSSRALGKAGEAILSGNVGKLIKTPARAA